MSEVDTGRREKRFSEVIWAIGMIMLAIGTLILVCMLFMPVRRHKSGRMPVWPIAGSVFINGKPAVGLLVSFHRVTDSDPPGASLDRLRPVAVVDPQGRFEISTFETADGAPEGTYQIALENYEPKNSRTPDRYRIDHLKGRFAAAAANAAADPEHFVVVVKPFEKSRVEPIIVPRIDIQFDGYVEVPQQADHSLAPKQ